MERLAGAVERFVCGSAGRVEVSKCRAVLGTAFAGGGSKLDGRVELGRLRKRSEAECSACRVGWAGLVMSKGGKRASMVALPQPAANGSLCGCGSWLGGRVGCANGAERRAAPVELCVSDWL